MLPPFWRFGAEGFFKDRVSRRAGAVVPRVYNRLRVASVKRPASRSLSLLAFTSLLIATALSLSSRKFTEQYKGTPYHDGRYQGGAQEIPGRVQCAYYDLGGEGVAYHDADTKNNGSGGLNPADGTYLNQFRMDEGVDISYTKFHDQIDNSPYNKVQPPENQLYVGWTEPGEWLNITVGVAHAGVYTADLLYTSNRGGTISLDVNGERATEPIAITSTFDASDPIAWRQWHHWNVMAKLATLRLREGKNILTIHIVTGGNMNLAYFGFMESLPSKCPGGISRS
jgi:hypothetical protein